MTRQATYKLDGIGPLFRQIKRAIADPILSGRLSPGTRLPSEQDLTELFDTSRMTVNRALQMLADDGLIIRRRRSGTFVAPQMSEHTVMELRDIGAEIEESGESYGYKRLSRQILADETVFGVPDANSPPRILHLRCRHLSGGKPHVIESRYINLSTVPDAQDQAFIDIPPGRWLMRNVPWTRGEHVIRAVNADPETAKLLEVPEATACLQVERTTWLADRPVTFVILTYPGDAHRLIGSFSPGT